MNSHSPKRLPNRLLFNQKARNHTGSGTAGTNMLRSDYKRPSSTISTHTPILLLPTEILHNIYRLIHHPRDQIAFALTCKHTAKISTDINLNKVTIIHWEKRRCYSHSNLMVDLRKWNWMPSHLKLCYQCYKFLPKQRIWTDRKGRELRTLRCVDWLWMIQSWLADGKRCPTCLMPDDFVEGEEWVQCEPRGVARWVPVRHKLLEAGTAE